MRLHKNEQLHILEPESGLERICMGNQIEIDALATEIFVLVWLWKKDYATKVWPD